VDPLVTAWELIPFSFIVDWFVNVNDNLAAFSPFATGEFAYGSLTTNEIWTTVTDVYCEKYPLLPSDGNDSLIIGDRHYQMVHVHRRKDRVASSPTLRFSVEVNLDPSKIVDLVSIFFLKRANLIRGLLTRTKL
jgi:hypothetical protein